MNGFYESGMTSPRARARMVARLREQGIYDEKVLTAMENVPRHLFVEEALASRAYDDTALPIGLGQTLSRPWMVARMSAIITHHHPRNILEIGTGSGYQAAVLSLLVPQVITVERHETLAHHAQETLAKLDITNTKVLHGDGFAGYRELSPFDAILVTAAGIAPSHELFHQLSPHGYLLMPQQDDAQEQNLYLYFQKQGKWQKEYAGPCKFVPMKPGLR